MIIVFYATKILIVKNALMGIRLILGFVLNLSIKKRTNA